MRLLLPPLMLLATSASAEFIPGSDILVGNWSGGAYTYDDTGAFSHCVVSAPYVSGDTLLLSVNENASVTVGVVSPVLKLQPGQEIPVSLFIDNRAPFYGSAIAQDTNFATLVLFDFENALTALQKGRTLVIESAAGSGSYDLAGTFKALNQTLECAVRHLNYTAKPSASAPPIDQAASSTPIDRTLLFQVATGMIADMGISDFVYLSEADTSAIFGSDAVAWKSQTVGILGGVVTVSANGLEQLKQTDGQDFDFLSKSCDGDVATTARNVSMTDYQSRELRMVCVEGESTTESLLNKTLIGNTVLYTLLVFDGTSQVSEPIERQQMSEQAALRAASFVTE